MTENGWSCYNQNNYEQKGIECYMTNKGNVKKRNPKQSSERMWRKKRRQRRIIIRACFLSVVLIVLVAAIWGVSAGIRKSSAKRSEEKAVKEAQIRAEEEALQNRKDLLAKAELLALEYDYESAIALIQSVEDYEQDADLVSAAAKYSAAKSTLVTVDAGTVQHLFFRPLIYDYDRAFNAALQGQSTVDTLKAWTVTVEEFQRILNQMYENGYVFVSIHDLADISINEDGTYTMKKSKSIKLPEGKTPVLLSIDDMSYYHNYENRGFADKLVISENGEIKAQYTDANGAVSVGDYDIIPILETFFSEHPDASYKGARGMIALSGYNGVFGYRTDIAYKTGENASADQQRWLSSHPDYNWDTEVAEATKVAEALKNNGWEFACNTWGKLNLSSASLETAKIDYEKWADTVENIVGETDVLVFPYGADMGNWKDYSTENQLYAYFKSQGMKFFCNVDTTQKVWVQIREQYFRQGRINVDGAMLSRMISGQTEVLNEVFDINQVCGTYR